MNVKCKNCHKGSQFIVCDCGYDKEQNIMTKPISTLNIIFRWLILISILLTLICILNV